MILKALEIIGFKSFPEKVLLEFSSGITGVIGPNGCGKSNLVDAIRWVLGEQSVKLMRGSKMEDFIFSGTARRKPLNYAEVSLTFDHADKYLPVEYQEIVITRRLYRSGEGEYYLNKIPCRLKDITELFWDTGIGTETYSLIGQGRIEQLINARPEEHRELFEEAAEIHKYKQRKKESLAKLEEMDRNLTRVEDLLAELKIRHAALSEAAQRAAQYRELSYKLKETEKKILSRRWLENNTLIQKIKNEKEKIGSNLKAKENILAELKARAGQVAGLEKTKLKKRERLKQLYQEQKEKRERLEGRIKLLREQKKFTAEKKILKEEALREVRERIAGLEETYKNNENELKIVLREQQSLGKKAAVLNNKLSEMQEQQYLSSLEELRQKKAEHNLKKVALEQSLETNRLRCREFEESLEMLEGRIRAKKEELDALKKAQSEVLATGQRVELDLAAKEKDFSLLEQHSQELDARIKEIKEQQSNLEKELQKKMARLRYLRESEEGLSFYAGGVRAVMKACSENPEMKGIYGPVAKLISVPPQLEKAMEVALGAKIQFIITVDDRAAQRAIEFLKEKRAGKATFLPLNILKPPAPKQLPTSAGGDLLGIASQLVNVPLEYKKAVDYLLGNVLVANNLQTALQLARKNRAAWSIVTLDGEMITPGGAISGGYQPEERSGFLGRKRELRNLEEAIQNIKKQFKDKNSEQEVLESRLNEIKEKLNNLATQLRKWEKERTKAQNDLEKVAAEIKRVKEELGQLEAEKSISLDKFVQLKNETAAKHEEYKLLQESCSTIMLELDKITRKVRVKQDDHKKMEKELVEIRIRFSALQEKESALQGMLRKQLQEKERLDVLVEALLTEKTGLQEEIRHLHDEEERLLLTLEKDGQEIRGLEELLHLLEQDLISLKDEKEELATEIEKEQKFLQRYERRGQNLNIELIKLEEAAKYLQEQLLDKFDINPQKEIGLLSTVSEPEDSLIKEKESLAAQMLSMGEVDLSAIKEFARLEKRVAFLEGQREDLLKGESGVKKILADLDQHMQKRFLEALEAIELNFFDIFTQLFGGGQAFLKLTDPENVLESGIEITVQPPGKKLQNISLLSGGEKALTAICLLFALLQYKPVPFCVLDEIDSSLDESNLSRYVRFLKKYVHDTQFIVITHRRKTMEEADVLYGITMEEQGVSKIVSLNLNKKAG